MVTKVGSQILATKFDLYQTANIQPQILAVLYNK